MVDVPEWVEAFIGIPFLLGGRSREASDCYGLCFVASRDGLDHHIPEYSGDRPEAGNDLDAIEDVMTFESATHWKFIDDGAERLGDLALFHMLGHDCHVGLVVAAGKFLHVRPGVNSCLESYRRQPWSKRLTGFYRYE